MLSAVAHPTTGIFRHNALKKQIARDASLADLSPIVEPAHILALGLKPDIFLPDFSLGKGAMCDVAVTDPTQKKFRKEAADNPLTAAEKYAIQEKESKYKEACESHGWSFHPLVVETTGGWCKSAQEIFSTIAGRIASRTNTPCNTALSQLYQRLAIILQRANANMIIERLPKII
jgi:hypothetical protein